MKRAGIACLLIIALSSFAAAQPTQTCESLSKLAIDKVKITNAATVEAGALPLPEGAPPQAAAMFRALPAFCRVQAVASPSADSSIAIEVWMPATNWNSRLRGIGNGGFAGAIAIPQLASGVNQGYAVASNDTGHKGGATDASWALGHPEKVIDFGHRGPHEMTRVAQALVRAFYGKPQQHAYFIGCSDGGREALMEAQRYPNDYDGIIAGAPANYWTHLLTSAIWDAQATTVPPEAYIPAAKLPAIAEAVNKACDAQDGVSDGVLNNPPACHFDPAVLRCEAAESNSCLTAPEVAGLKKIYEGAHDSKGQKLFPGFLPGAETGGGGWSTWITGQTPGKALLFEFGIGYFSNIVYEKKDWDYRTAKIDDIVKAADEKTASILNSTNPDLSAFKGHGGKLLIYHGWNDPAISALNTIDYFQSVAAKMGNVDSFARLYMVPGMQHCAGGAGATDLGQGGGPGDAQHNIARALEEWVEKGQAPSTIIARKPGANPPMTRPLCPYPQLAKYKGTGDTNDAANFSCAEK